MLNFGVVKKLKSKTTLILQTGCTHFLITEKIITIFFNIYIIYNSGLLHHDVGLVTVATAEKITKVALILDAPMEEMMKKKIPQVDVEDSAQGFLDQMMMKKSVLEIASHTLKRRMEKHTNPSVSRSLIPKMPPEVHLVVA